MPVAPFPLNGQPYIGTACKFSSAAPPPKEVSERWKRRMEKEDTFTKKRRELYNLLQLKGDGAVEPLIMPSSDYDLKCHDGWLAAGCPAECPPVPKIPPLPSS